MNEREAYIALNMMERIGPIAVRSLISVLGSACAIFSCSRSELMAADGIGRENADAILAQREMLDWRGELDKVEALGARILTRVDSEYPEALSQIHDPPLAITVKGTLRCRDSHAIAIVGMRRASHYGRDVAEQMGYGLAKAGLVVVSGLAKGIDTAAHKGALRSGGRTIAVLGSGFDYLYPAENQELAEEIAGSGAVISEFPCSRSPDKTTFPMRNRIVSGLSKGVLVVEAGSRSGALITVNQALEQGRSVFAVPGRIDSRGSSGPHSLIRTGAILVNCIDDVLEEFDGLLPASAGRSTPAEQPMPELSEEQETLVQLIRTGEQQVDGLIRSSGLRAARVSSLLIGLEMMRVIRMLPGRIVELIRK